MSFPSTARMTAFICAVIFSAGLAVAPLYAEPPQLFQGKLLGDQAMLDRQYSLAAEFYRRYKKEAGENREALSDAYKSTLNALIMSGNRTEASLELDAYREAFPFEKTESSIFSGEILMMNGNPKEAAQAFEAMLKDLNPPDQNYFNCLYKLGMAYMQMRDWDKALKTFISLESDGKDTKWQDLAFLRAVFCMIYAGRTADAVASLDSHESVGRTDYKILYLLADVKSRKTASLRQSYDRLKQEMKDLRNPFFYALSFAAGELYLNEKNYETALYYLNDAVLSAPSNEEKYVAGLTLIRALCESNRRDEAVLIALRLADTMRDAVEGSRMKLAAARLYSDAGRDFDSFTVYREIFDNGSILREIRFNAAREASALCIKQKDFNKAYDIINRVFGRSQDDATAGEKAYLLAELLYRQGRIAEASKAFIKLSETSKLWREKALYQAMRMLLELGDYKASQNYCEQIINEFPAGETVRNAIYFYAVNEEKLGKYQKAAALFADFAKDYPNHDYAPKASFAAGLDSEKAGKLSEAETYYDLTIKAYPFTVYAPMSLYKRIILKFRSERNEEALKDLKILAEKYPESEYCISAFFSAAGVYRDSGDYVKSAEILGKMLEKYKNNQDLIPDILYEKAYMEYRKGDFDQALFMLGELSGRYSSSRAASEGLFLNGEIYSEKGEFAKAAAFYNKAMDRRPDSLLEAVAAGRLGDCNFSMYSESFDRKYLTASVSAYERALNAKECPPALKPQLIYKAGRAFELAGDEETSLKKYREVYYGVFSGLYKGRDTVFWLVKSANGIIAVCKGRNNSESAMEAVSVCNKMVDAGIGPVEDYKRTASELSGKYKN